MNRKIKVPKGHSRAAIDSTVNEEARTVDLTWTTGAKGLRRTWDGNYYEELSLDPEHVDMSRLESGAPLLAAHDSYSLDSVVGVIERAWLEGDKAGATVRFAKDEISERIFQKVKDKILRNVSVGYQVSKYEDVSAENDKIPTLRATRWQPMEISIVPIGFDQAAQVRKDETTNENEVEIISRSTTQDDSKESEAMTVKKDDLATAPQVDAEAIKKEAAAQERTRANEIRYAVRTAKLEDSFADTLVDQGVSADEARKQVFAKLSEKSEAEKINPTVRIEVGQDAREKTREGIEGALLYRMDKKNFSLDDNSKRFAGRSLVRMAEELIGRSHGMSDVQIVKRAMSTSNLPLTLANVAEKTAAKQYALAAATFKGWTNSGELRNYKEAKQIKSGDFSSLEERQEGGEFKQGSMGEEQEVAQLQDYGKILRLTKQMIVNDDLGVLTQIISKAGVAARRKESQLVYNVLLDNAAMEDGVALFHADHGNLLSASAINDAGMKAAVKAMRAQTTIDGEDNLELAPAFLIVGPDKENEAKKFLQQITAAQTSNVNIYANSMELVIENRITGNKWFTAASPSQCDTVTLFGLAGQTDPVIESRTRWEDSSVEFKVEHTIDAAAMDHRGMTYNPGA